MSEQRDRVRELAEKMFDGLTAVDWAEGLIREELRELLDACDKTIQFYEAHGGPMADLRAQLKDWRGK